MSNLDGLIGNVVTTIDALVNAAIHQDKHDNQDSMGTYYEEKALHKALTELVAEVKKPTPE